MGRDQVGVSWRSALQKMVIIVVETYLGRGGWLGPAVVVPGRVVKVIVGSA
jgi:hypothetical protein